MKMWKDIECTIPAQSGDSVAAVTNDAREIIGIQADEKKRPIARVLPPPGSISPFWIDGEDGEDNSTPQRFLGPPNTKRRPPIMKETTNND